MATTNPSTHKDESKSGQQSTHFQSGQAGEMGTLDRAKEAASNAADKARDTASNLADKARDAASSAGQSARQMAHEAQRRGENAASSVGGGMQSMADTIREKGPQEGFLGQASSRLAERLDRGGRYLQEEGLSGLADDFSAVIRRNPIPAVCVAVGLGLLLGLATSSRR